MDPHDPEHPVVAELKATDAAQETKIKQNDDKLTKWSEFFSTPQGKVIGGLLISVLGYLIAQLTGWMNPTPPAPINISTPPAQVTVAPTPVVNHMQVVAPKYNIVVYITSEEQLKLVQADAKLKDFGVVVDTTIYPVGSRLKDCLLPCAAKVDDKGLVVDVRHIDASIPGIAGSVVQGWLKK